MTPRTRRTVAAGLVLGFAVNILVGLSPFPPSTPAAAASCSANADAPVIAAPSWGQQRMGPERAWPRTTGDVVVAVVDTGVSARTASLVGAVLPGSNLDGGRGDADCFGRGTFIASLIAGRVLDGTAFAGVAPGATILPIRVTDDPSDFQLDAKLPGLLASAINTSVSAGARVIAIPLTTSRADESLRNAVNAAIRKDVLIVASAANYDGAPTFPAQWDGVLSVAPLTPSGGVDASKMGAEPDLASPSSDLIGAVPDGAGHIAGSDDGVAVGYVAAAAALVMDEYPDLSVKEVMARLLDTADGASASSSMEGTRDSSLGFGVVNPFAAVARLDSDVTAISAPAVTALALPPKPDERPVNLALAIALGALVAAVLVVGPTVGVVLSRRKPVGE